MRYSTPFLHHLLVLLLSPLYKSLNLTESEHFSFPDYVILSLEMFYGFSSLHDIAIQYHYHIEHSNNYSMTLLIFYKRFTRNFDVRPRLIYAK